MPRTISCAPYCACPMFVTIVLCMFGRRRPPARQDPGPPRDPLLTLPRIAELIDRDPSRVHRYRSAGQLPPPDEVMAGGTEAWRQSTIRSWWAARGGRISTDADTELPRYLEPWNRAEALPPALLEQFVIDWQLDNQANPGVPTTPVHVRIYRGSDGQGPVVLLAPMAPRSIIAARGRQWTELFTDVRRRAVTDLDFAAPLWIHLDTHDRWSASSFSEVFSIPPVNLFDVSAAPTAHLNRSGTYRPSHPSPDLFVNDPPSVSLADLSRLIGLPIELYPLDNDLYTADTIRSREPHLGDPDPTPILRDVAHVQQQLNHLRALVTYSQATEDAEAADVINFAVGIFAETTTNANADAEYVRQHISYESTDRPLADSDHRQLAVRITPRILNNAERNEVAALLPEQPLRQRAKRPDPADNGGSWTPPPPDIVHPGAAHQLPRLRRLLENPELAEEARERVALAEAEQRISAALRDADASFERADRQPVISVFSAASPETAAYLATLPQQITTDPEDMAKHLVRRARRLTAKLERRTFTSIDAPRTFLVDNHRTGDELLLLQTVETNSRNAGPDDEEEDYDSPIVIMEWPKALIEPDQFRASINPGDRIRSPSSTYDLYRPVYLLRADGITWEPLPGGDDHAWGVSGTDTLTPWLHSLFSSRPLPGNFDGRDDPESLQLREWLFDTTVRASLAGPLDVDAHEIARRYTAWEATTPEPTDHEVQ